MAVAVVEAEAEAVAVAVAEAVAVAYLLIVRGHLGSLLLRHAAHEALPLRVESAQSVAISGN